VLRAIAALRRTGLPASHLDREEPGWFRHRFLGEHGVLERERSAAPALPRSSGVLGELHAYLRYPFFARVFSLVHAFALEEGVESRSPLFDERIVRFAARRPWSDRVDRRETKLVLREAMRGLLPERVLAPRAHRTGVPTAYFFRQLRGPARPVVDAMLQDSHLASIGMIDIARFRNAWEHVLRHDDGETSARIWFTVQAELWLRTHEAGVTG
jgi:asparagine synthetase B (glutamine-hydrolysing)